MLNRRHKNKRHTQNSFNPFFLKNATVYHEKKSISQLQQQQHHTNYWIQYIYKIQLNYILINVFHVLTNKKKFIVITHSSNWRENKKQKKNYIYYEYLYCILCVDVNFIGGTVAEAVAVETAKQQQKCSLVKLSL